MLVESDKQLFLKWIIVNFYRGREGGILCIYVSNSPEYINLVLSFSACNAQSIPFENLSWSKLWEGVFKDS